jgi:hypothetical protein
MSEIKSLEQNLTTKQVLIDSLTEQMKAAEKR